MKFKYVTNRNTTTLTLTAQQLQNLFTFMKNGKLHMEFYPVQAKTGVNGQLQFEIVIANSLLSRVRQESILDAITSGMLR